MLLLSPQMVRFLPARVGTTPFVYGMPTLAKTYSRLEGISATLLPSPFLPTGARLPVGAATTAFGYGMPVQVNFC